MEEAPAAAVEEGLPDDTRDAATSPMPSTSMPPWSRRVRPRVTTTTRCRRWRTARYGT